MSEHAIVELDWQPSVHTLRQFGFIAAAVFGALSYAAWRHNVQPLTVIAAVIACSAALSSLLRPAWNRPLYVGLSVLSYPIAWLSAWVMLIALFFLVITPSALLYRALVRRRRVRVNGSAWQPARKERNKSNYFRQF